VGTFSILYHHDIICSAAVSAAIDTGGPYGPFETPAMGLMYLAGALREKGDWSIGIDDSRFHWGDLSRVMANVRRRAPDVVGISSITMEAPFMHRLAAEIKKEFPETNIVAGGPHPSMYPEDTLADRNIDYAVIGEVLFRLQRTAFRRFHLHPNRIWRILRDHPHRICLPDYLRLTLRRILIKERGNK